MNDKPANSNISARESAARKPGIRLRISNRVSSIQFAAALFSLFLLVLFIFFQVIRLAHSNFSGRAAEAAASLSAMVAASAAILAASGATTRLIEFHLFRSVFAPEVTKLKSDAGGTSSSVADSWFEKFPRWQLLIVIPTSLCASLGFESLLILVSNRSDDFLNAWFSTLRSWSWQVPVFLVISEVIYLAWAVEGLLMKAELVAIGWRWKRISPEDASRDSLRARAHYLLTELGSRGLDIEGKSDERRREDAMEKEGRRLFSLFTRNELASGVILAVLGSIVWEWLIKLPLEYAVPSITTAFVNITHFKDSITQNAAVYTESFALLLVVTGILTFFFRAIAEVVSFSIDQNELKWKIQRITNWAAQAFFVIIASVNAYGGLIAHNRIIWFRQSMDIMTPVISQAELARLRADWASMKTQSDFEKVTSEVQAAADGAKLKLRIEPPPS